MKKFDFCLGYPLMYVILFIGGLFFFGIPPIAAFAMGGKSILTECWSLKGLSSLTFVYTSAGILLLFIFTTPLLIIYGGCLQRFGSGGNENSKRPVGGAIFILVSLLMLILFIVGVVGLVGSATSEDSSPTSPTSPAKAGCEKSNTILIIFLLIDLTLAGIFSFFGSAFSCC